MKKVVIQLLVISSLFIFTACSSTTNEQGGSVADGEANQTGASAGNAAEENKRKVGFTLDGDSIEEAANVPEADKAEILKAYASYLKSINEQDIDAHLALLSKEADFVESEEQYRAVLEEQFGDFSMDYQSKTETINFYEPDEEAHVWADMDITVTPKPEGTPFEQLGKQVTVFVKEDGQWKVVAVHFKGDTTEE